MNHFLEHFAVLPTILMHFQNETIAHHKIKKINELGREVVLFYHKNGQMEAAELFPVITISLLYWLSLEQF